MAEDYSILELELIDLKAQLKRDLHMHHVRRLSKKKDVLAMQHSQRKQIKNLERQKADIEPTVSMLYSPHHSLKDNDIRGYLIYLLKMKDFFTREVATKQQMISQKESQIKGMLRKLCVATNEEAARIRSMPIKSPEFVRLENMSNRMEQMNKRICTMRQENKEIMLNIVDMRKFQKQFKIFEKDFRRKINNLKSEALGCLTRAVAAYEEKDEFMNKERVFQERRAQDLRKMAINENALNLVIQKTEKNTAFANLQDIKRTDVRIAETGDMIAEGITGLEPTLEKSQGLHDSISQAAGEETPETMEDSFKLKDDVTVGMFSYLDELLKDINHLQTSVENLKEENMDLMKNMSAGDKNMKRNISMTQNAAQKKLEEAEEVMKVKDEARREMDDLLESVRSLYTKICFDDGDAVSLQEAIDDSNVMDYLQDMQKHILEYLICGEYIRMKEVSEDDERTPIVLEPEDDVDLDDAIQELEPYAVVQPRILKSECELQALVDMDEEKYFLEFAELKERAVKAVEETESEKSGDEIDVSDAT